MSVFDKPEALDEYEHDRELKRMKGGRLTFDCFNAKTDGHKVWCTKGQILNKQAKDGRILIYPILRGTRVSVCQICVDYDDYEEVKDVSES